MAAYTRHNIQGVSRHLKHNTREFPNSKKISNRDIDFSRTSNNKVLHPEDRGIDVRDSSQSLKYYHERMKHVYRMNRSDTICTGEWCITAPKELPDEYILPFFKTTYEFLNSEYGSDTDNMSNNCIQCILHYDEGFSYLGKQYGRPHMHYTFIKVKKIDNKEEYKKKLEAIQEKYSGNKAYLRKALKRLNKSKKYKYPEKLDFQSLDVEYLSTFHDRFQAWINNWIKEGIEKGELPEDFSCRVKTEETQGKNQTVSQLKNHTREFEQTYLQEYENPLTVEYEEEYVW